MSVGSLGGLLGSAAGAPLSQATGSEAERAHRDGSVQQRTVDAAQQAELAAGIGTTEQDQETGERDADGRRLWEAPSEKKTNNPANSESIVTARQSKDATGQSGNQLDLTG